MAAKAVCAYPCQSNAVDAQDHARSSRRDHAWPQKLYAHIHVIQTPLIVKTARSSRHAHARPSKPSAHIHVSQTPLTIKTARPSRRDASIHGHQSRPCTHLRAVIAAGRACNAAHMFGCARGLRLARINSNTRPADRSCRPLRGRISHLIRFEAAAQVCRSCQVRTRCTHYPP